MHVSWLIFGVHSARWKGSEEKRGWRIPGVWKYISEWDEIMHEGIDKEKEGRNGETKL